MSSTVTMIGQKISGGYAWTLGAGKASGLWMYANILTPVHTTIAGSLVKVVGKVTAVSGNIGGGIGIAIMLLSLDYAANRLWHQKDLLADQRALQIAARVLGFTLAAAVGVATTAAFGAALGVTITTYGIGLAVTAFTLLVDFDPPKRGEGRPEGNEKEKEKKA